MEQSFKKSNWNSMRIEQFFEVYTSSSIHWKYNLISLHIIHVISLILECVESYLHGSVLFQNCLYIVDVSLLGTKINRFAEDLK